MRRTACHTSHRPYRIAQRRSGGSHNALRSGKAENRRLTKPIKHTSHDHSFDAQGKDTYNFKESGAKAALIYSPLKYMMVQDYEKSVNENDDLSNFIDKMKGYDLIILEGFKHINNIPKIEVFRSSVSDKPFCDDKSIMALVTDNLSYKTDLPILNINDISSIPLLIFLTISLSIVVFPFPGGDTINVVKIVWFSKSNISLITLFHFLFQYTI